MKCAWLIVLSVSLFLRGAPAEDNSPLKTEKEVNSYAMGVDLARNLKRQGISLDIDLVLRGLKEGYGEEKVLLSEPELRKARNALQTASRQQQGQLKGKTLAEINLRKGEAFLAENRSRPGVVTLTNGIQYLVIKPGAGRPPGATDTVQCHYRATLLDGTEFLRSNPSQPATFKVGEPPVPGWDKILKLMPPGAKWRCFVPPQHAYGPGGVGRDVGPNETLIFDLELIATK